MPKFFAFLEKQPNDSVVHFTNWNRVGFNPKPTHQDPIGVYTFPKKYVMSPQFKNNSSFFGMNNAFILRIKSGFRTLNLSTISASEVQRLIQAMGLTEGDPTGHHSLKQGVQAKPGHLLWDALEKTLQQMNIYGPKKNLQWNKLFKKAGIDVLVDDGDSIIHHNEPYQVVFLTPGSYQEITFFQHGVDKIYKQLAFRIMKIASNKLFDSEPRFSSHKKYSDTTIYAYGKYKGKPIVIWTTFYEKERKVLDQPLRVTLNLSSHFTNKYSPESSKDERSVEVSFNPEDPNIEAQVERAVANFKSQMEEPGYFRENKSEVVKKLVQSALKILGLTGNIKKDNEREGWEYKRYYKGVGTFTIRGFYSGYGETYHLAMSLKEEDGMTLHGYDKADMPAKQVEANPEASALELLKKSFDYWDETQERLYPTDREKYDASDWRSYEKIKIGERWKKFINFMRKKMSNYLPLFHRNQ